MATAKFSAVVKARVMARSGGFCEVRSPHCWDEATQLHHRRPRGMGGSRDLRSAGAANALSVCVPCHLDVESNRAESLERGWLVRQAADPAQVPLLRYRKWVLLDDQGGITPTGATP
ncbi:hypothetical protein [Dietzia alimentaria]|uniref:hypothetical protein n=1 Tax=Dietzia alimentaria TaxID=665550 RepID=UPI00029A5E15|nr:hypothetical protein [Dietzia alimentaria]